MTIDFEQILRSSTTAEKPLQASKWLQIQVLLSKNELSELFDFLDSTAIFYLYACGTVCPKGKGEISKDAFLENYKNYIDSLMQGKLPEPSLYRSVFSPVLTATPNALFTIPVGNDRQIIRISKPVIQLQAHNMDYSEVNKKFHSMIFGLESISWGIQFSYPQLYLDNQTKQVEIIKKSQAFPNTILFQTLQKWMRQHTIPTPFIAEENIINVPMRLGKDCLSWINNHPSLIKKNISVKTIKNQGAISDNLILEPPN
jgi:hypothetical protein